MQIEHSWGCGSSSPGTETAMQSFSVAVKRTICVGIILAGGGTEDDDGTEVDVVFGAGNEDDRFDSERSARWREVDREGSCLLIQSMM